MKQLSFKQYLESKKQLREAIEQTPVTVIEYEVKKYCSLCIGETKQESRTVGLKPKQQIIIEWRYDQLDDPTPTYIKFNNIKAVDLDEEQHPTYWSGKKLQKWLIRHTKKEHSHVN